MGEPALDDEKRQFQRIPFIAEVVVRQSEQQWNCSLIDISLKGFLIQPPMDSIPQLDQSYAIELKLSDDVAICSQAEVIHHNERFWGFQWSNIDIDSFSRLRRLLEHNTADPQQIYRELAELMES